MAGQQHLVLQGSLPQEGVQPTAATLCGRVHDRHTGVGRRPDRVDICVPNAEAVLGCVWGLLLPNVAHGEAVNSFPFISL